MPALTRFVLRHKALVALLWLAVAVAGVMTVGGTTHRMTNDFSMPGQAFTVDNQIVREYGNGGSQAPYVPVLTVAPGERVTDPAVALLHPSDRICTARWIGATISAVSVPRVQACGISNVSRCASIP